MILDDTIVAISSATGESARIIVRLSGPAAQSIAARLTRRTGRFSDQSSVERCDLYLEQIQSLQYSAWVYAFITPKSYTGQDLIEMHLPGNPLLARLTLQACQRAGARLAGPGEFTARAYFNGRLDLTQAEGVAATIAANGESELGAARQLLAGELARRLKPPMDLLADTLAMVEVGIDFVEEEVSFLSAVEVATRIDRIDTSLANLQSTSGRFERLTHAPRVVLVGPPNAGKSTLLNALAGHARAVVSPIAGTTRDVLSATVFLRRGAIELIDVAGLESASPAATEAQQDIDRQMQSQARQAIETADLVVQVCEAAEQDRSIDLPRPADLIVRTKVDLHPTGDSSASVPISTLPVPAIAVSAITGQGMTQFRETLDALAFGSEAPAATLALMSRHWQAIDAARSSLARAKSQHAAEVIAADLREALDQLGEILGQVAPDELLGKIFSAFCIGK